MAIDVGSIVEGVVTGITNFGAFIELPDRVTGLVHISEVADAYVKDVRDYLKEQDHVKVKVIHVDEKGKIGLSIKQANPTVRNVGRERRLPPTVSFEDKLAKFIKDSDERQTEFRRATDSKRGGRGSSRY
ncbi:MULTISPECIES: S1 RNA-binding domain-containing protein [Desulfosporosinus]|jgi:S1 RNA binding domain protein|uniref:Putative RNA-binding protein with ribosomal protein S1 domain n=1 Tax=Desulfosporosinus orientis (strain ATCC 19365 / DSM 765 / NCIMB 8382 / VKM B-1628 / Singapore I) TaxID=768706 RepID=G7W7F9_DESOD|nr:MULTISPECIES: S1 RNA-binding domain-containing protein [Desulfosporosinus]KUO73849.1 MAG: RNA-binding protein S1 [Desulfosporosinus sp. BRH_c37]AET65830.1 putative RNA-binding protein with ribosomal protein S1 domain [Desulfosporosinus orientis DSM 765]KJS86730.1 MAG: RNA-binding protein S1 [Desulfosporosinus sp. BICA1-9]MBC2722159.1 S1 RNA-binding domain-containing protein [Desulfosporosinus sp.]MBC2727821.1 S1 RNA-binding domain-containing protein [Desulfosporosinus sp.]